MSVLSRFPPPRDGDAQAPEPRNRSETGDTLIEVLLAIVIIGITAVSLLAGFATSISASAEHRDLVTLDTILTSYVESATYQLQQQSSPLFLPCATTYSPTFTVPTGNSGYTVQISSVSYWNGTAFTGSCTAGSTAPQQITAHGTGPAHTSDSLNFIVVDPAFQSPGGTPTQLVVTTEPPSSSTSGANFAVSVSVEDTLGNIVTTPSTPILLAIASNPSGGTLTCAPNPVNSSNGASVFSCSVDLVGTGYTVTATSSAFGSVTTTPFSITAGTVNQLTIVSSPVSGTASSSPALGPITVQEQDAAGNPTTAAETVTLASSSTGAKFAGTANGAPITSLSIPTGSSSATFYYGDTSSGSPIITVSSPGLSPDTQNEIINAGPAVKLAFTPSSPGPGRAGSSIPHVVVQQEDSFGNATAGSTGTVGLTIHSGPQPGFTTGTLTAGLNNGVATFSDLVVVASGSYTLTATPSGMSGVAAANSSSFTVSAGTASTFTVTTPGTQTAGIAFNDVITAYDAYNNIATGYGGAQPITFSGPLASPSSTSPTYPITVTFASGVGTASNIKLVDAQSTTLTATQGSIAGASASFMVVAGNAGQLSVNAPPTAAAGSSATGITLTAQDLYGNTATTYATGNHTITWSGPPNSPAPANDVPTLPTSTVSFANGVNTTPLSATFYFAGINTLTATDSSSDTGSDTVAVAPLGAATFSVANPGNRTVGTAFSDAITAIDSYGNTATSYTGVQAITFSGPANSPNLTSPVYPVSVTFTSGLGTASGMTLFDAQSTALTATQNSIAGTSGSFTMGPGTAQALGFTAQPSGATAITAAFSIQPVVATEDAFGNTVSGTNNVTLTTGTGSTGTLSGCTSAVAQVGGVATFSACKWSAVGTGDSVTATSGSLTATSQLFNMTGVAAKLIVTTQPSTTAVAAVAFVVQPVVSVEDSSGRIVTADSSTVALAIGSGGKAGAVLSCSSTLSVQVSYGVAPISGCSINNSSTSAYILRASDGALTASNTTGITVSAGPAAQVVFTTPPGNGVHAANLSTQPVVSIEDAEGNVVTTNTSSVTLAIGTNPGVGALSCTTNPKPAVAGVATFAGCRVSLAGTGYTLIATDGSLTATSATFNVT